MLLSVLGSFSVIPVLAQSNDLLVNSDFVDGLYGWNINVTLHVNYSWLSEFQGRSGVVVVESNSSTGGRFDIYQIINVEKNTSAVYVIDLYSNSSCSDCYIDVLVYNPNISQYYIIDRISVGNFTGWRSFEKYVSIPSGSWEFYILIHSYEPGLYVGIDAVHLLIDNSNGVAVMGGFVEDFEKYWYLVAYIPILIVIAGSLGYLIEKKMIIRKLIKSE